MAAKNINKNSQDYVFAQLATSVEGINEKMGGLREDLKKTNDNFEIFKIAICKQVTDIQTELAFIKGKLIVWTIIASAVVGGAVSLIFKIINP
jgi:hypothetical protein